MSITPAANPSGAIADGEWRYADSKGYPSAGFGLSGAQPDLSISCQRGEIVFHLSSTLQAGTATLIVTQGKETIRMRALETMQPILEGRLPANAPFINALLLSNDPFSIETGVQKLTLPSDTAYRRVIRDCLTT